MTDISALLVNDRSAMRVTIDEVANALGLAKSTVSRALNDYPDISEATRLRVKRVAEKMNYQPLSHAQAIKTGRTRSIGLVLQLSDHDAQRPFLAEFLSGLSEGASSEGFTLTVASADDNEHLIEIFRMLLRDGKADGFILPRVMDDDQRVDMLRTAEVPFVLYGRQENEDGCSWFDVRGEEAMHDAVLHLASLGHRKIAFINGGLIYHYASLRREGYLKGLSDANLDVNPSYIFENAVTHAEGMDAASKLLNLEDRPTAVVCAVDRTALGVYSAAHLQNLKIGKDLSVVAYDGIEDGAYANPPLSTFAVDNRSAGKHLANLLIRRIRGEPLKNLRMTVAAHFLDRGSTGPAP